MRFCPFPSFPSLPFLRQPHRCAFLSSFFASGRCCSVAFLLPHALPSLSLSLSFPPPSPSPPPLLSLPFLCPAGFLNTPILNNGQQTTTATTTATTTTTTLCHLLPPTAIPPYPPPSPPKIPSTHYPALDIQYPYFASHHLLPFSTPNIAHLSRRESITTHSLHIPSELAAKV